MKEAPIYKCINSIGPVGLSVIGISGLSAKLNMPERK